MSSLTASRRRWSGRLRLSFTSSGLRMRSSVQSRRPPFSRPPKLLFVADSLSSSQAVSTRPKNLSASPSKSATSVTALPLRKVVNSPFSVLGFQRRCNAYRTCPLERLSPICFEATLSIWWASSKIRKSFLKRMPPWLSSSIDPSSVKNRV